MEIKNIIMCHTEFYPYLLGAYNNKTKNTVCPIIVIEVRFQVTWHFHCLCSTILNFHKSCESTVLSFLNLMVNSYLIIPKTGMLGVYFISFFVYYKPLHLFE